LHSKDNVSRKEELVIILGLKKRVPIGLLICKFLGLPDQDPLERGTGTDADPDPSIIMQN
jgi:hypothetical protein